jgi:ABC-type Fe3+-siderophore transport system permease subunit
MDVTEPPKPATSPLPQGYRQGLVTAITVLLGFSLSFMRFWGIESPGHWTWKGVLCACLFGVGILVELWALFRSLDLRDDEAVRYSGTVRWFFTGAIIVIVGVTASILVAE